jgi:hypothetical protein
MEPSESLLEDARAARDSGDLRKAQLLFLQILELYPRTDEADEAIKFLLANPRRPAAPDEGGGRAPRRKAGGE